MRPRLVAAALGVLALVAPLPSAGATSAVAAPDRPRWDTRVFSLVPPPGFPAYVYVHPNGRVYAGTYTNPRGDSTPSRVLEWSRRGTLLRSWQVPGQDLAAEHGVQVATSDARGRLVLLERSTARVLLLDPRTGRFRTYATVPDLPTCGPARAARCSPNAADVPAIPNYAAWGPDGSLYVSDYGQAVIWRVPPGGGRPRAWFRDPRLDGSEFGTAGLVLAPGHRALLLTQQSSVPPGEADPTTGKLYRLPIRSDGRPGRLHTMWESRPGDLPDGFGLARSGRIYVSLAGLANQLVVLDRRGRELERFPPVPAAGDNGSPVPFDTPSSATFLGSRVLVANQGFFGQRDHHAILDVEVGERGIAPYVPAGAGVR